MLLLKYIITPFQFENRIQHIIECLATNQFFHKSTKININKVHRFSDPKIATRTWGRIEFDIQSQHLNLNRTHHETHTNIFIMLQMNVSLMK